MPGWDRAGFNDKGWLSVATFADTGAALVATNGPTVRRIEERTPISEPVNKGNFLANRAIFDLGQNMVGWVRFKGSAPAGTTVTLRFAEVLDDKGDLYTTNLRNGREWNPALKTAMRDCATGPQLGYSANSATEVDSAIRAMFAAVVEKARLVR